MPLVAVFLSQACAQLFASLTIVLSCHIIRHNKLLLLPSLAAAKRLVASPRTTRIESPSDFFSSLGLLAFITFWGSVTQSFLGCAKHSTFAGCRKGSLNAYLAQTITCSGHHLDNSVFYPFQQCIATDCSER